MFTSALAHLVGLTISSPVRASRRFRPSLEVLSARDVPAVYIWTGAVNTDADTIGN